MDNPFLRRATEQLRDDEAFLAVVSHEPLSYFLKPHGRSGRLYDRLVLMRGTPGSGKTTIARLFEYATLTTLLRGKDSPAYQELAAAVIECGAAGERGPRLLGCRLPMETDYRNFWEFPYRPTLKLRLMMALIQARAILAWFRNLASQGVHLSQVSILPRPGSENVSNSIGGLTGNEVAQRARQVERALYEVMEALVAPPESSLPATVIEPYQPFDIIELVKIDHSDGREEILQPLVILDDAHTLPATLFSEMKRTLARRELRIARWIISRLDSLSIEDTYGLGLCDTADSAADNLPGLNQDREIQSILLQGGDESRREVRLKFRTMAKNLSKKYLLQMPLLSSRGLVSLENLLSEEEPRPSPSDLALLSDLADTVQRRLRISATWRASYEKQLRDFRTKGKPVPADIEKAMLVIMLHRHDKRIGQPSLFEDEDPVPSRQVVANDGVLESARIQQLHRMERPYFYGIDNLCDASSENIEQFLQLSAKLVERVTTQAIRNKPVRLSPMIQNQLLRSRGQEIVQGWNFPKCTQVTKLVSRMAERCVEVSLQPNGWLTPNAFGIEQIDFQRMLSMRSGLAEVIHYGLAYNAISLVTNHQTKGREWCLLELGGALILKHGLSLKRGGFVESSTRELASFIQEQGL